MAIDRVPASLTAMGMPWEKEAAFRNSVYTYRERGGAGRKIDKWLWDGLLHALCRASAKQALAIVATVASVSMPPPVSFHTDYDKHICISIASPSGCAHNQPAAAEAGSAAWRTQCSA